MTPVSIYITSLSFVYYLSSLLDLLYISGFSAPNISGCVSFVFLVFWSALVGECVVAAFLCFSCYFYILSLSLHLCGHNASSGQVVLLLW